MVTLSEETRLELPFEFRVAGTGYERRYSTIRRYAKKRSEIRLIPEPGNEFDANAIGVRVLWITDVGTEVWDPIGYIPAALSPIVGALIRSGEWAIERAFVRRLDTSPDRDAPLVVVRIEGKDLREGLP